MAEICGEEHPEQPGLSCDKPTHPFGSHFHRDSAAVWDGVPLPQRTRRGASRVLEVVKAMDEHGSGRKTGPPSVEDGPPPRAESFWRLEQERWLERAKQALKQVCEANETFTNEAVWLLVPDIRERRAMVIVTRHGLRSGWMHEDSAVRVKGDWRTADGVTFPLNKLVPVYRSDLLRP